MITNVSTTIKINENIAKNLMTAKQACWLKNAIKDYNLNLDINTIDSCGLASEHITRIMNQINKGTLKKNVAPVVSDVWYVVIKQIDVISIKTFIGSKIEASAKARAKYGECVKFASTELEVSKAEATKLRNNLIADEVAITTTDAELTMDALNALSVEDLRQLASDMGVELGRSKKRETIIARILA